MLRFRITRCRCREKFFPWGNLGGNHFHRNIFHIPAHKADIVGCVMTVAGSGAIGFVNKGIRVEPLYVTRIEDNSGNIIAQFTPQMYEIISEETSYKMLAMLQAVINEGTGIRLRYRYQFKGDIGGKTGTTQNNSDGWFLGVTPELVSGAWVGGEDRSIHFDSMKEGQGASMALPVWALYMKKVYADKTLGYADTTHFDIPDYYLKQYNCTEKVSGSDFSDDIFGL